MLGEEVEDNLIPKDPKICFLGNYPPKECGIATFTKHLVGAMNRNFNPKLRSRVIALNDPQAHYNYDHKVIHQITRNSPKEYQEMARTINESPDHRLVCIQHEFGLYGGGDYGENIFYFLDEIKKPTIVTFHSVLPDPEPKRKQVVKRISEKASAIVVMAQSAIEILNRDYGIERSKIYVIHHGTPNARFVPSEQYKKKLNIDPKRKVILTFGLLSRGKGIEYMIKSLPEVVKKHPDILYIILGETHPDIRRKKGEAYRNELSELIQELDLEKNVKFHNKYVTEKNLVEYLLASDIYAFTNLEEVQITSGTLAYAVSCGRPVVATPIVYAKELLAQDRGIIVKDFRNPEGFTKALHRLLDDPEMRNNMSEAAYAFGRQMIWTNVAKRHLTVFNRIVKLREEVTKKYPQIKLEHLKRLTDSFGCLQFSKGSTPDKNSGYTVDDNSRALMAALLHNNLFGSRLSHNLAKRYTSFLEHAQEKNGDFNNIFMKKDKPLNKFSEDAFGRTIYALGYALSKAKNKKLLHRSKKLFDKAYKKINQIESLRGKAFIIMGLYYAYKKFPENKYLEKIKKFSRDLVRSYRENSSEDWEWFEDKMTYDNAKIPESLFMAYKLTGIENYRDAAEKTLHFLSDITFEGDELHPIGQNGWFDKNGRRSFFDQQPIDAAAMVHAYLTAYEATYDKHYYEKAVLSFNWFLGKNHLKQVLYDEGTGGCFDGLGKHAINLNQGAESTISYLLARLMLEEIKRETQDI